MRNLADDALHGPAQKGEILKITKLTVDNLQGNLILVLDTTAIQLRSNDLRDQGNARIEEQRTIKPKPPKSQLDIFTEYIANKEWTQEFFGENSVWICDFDNLFQIHSRQDYEDFSEPWTQVFADASGSGKHSVDLVYNGTPLKRYIFIYADGARIGVVMPRTGLAAADIDKEDDIDHRFFYWNKSDLGYKLMELIGSFYIYGTPEGVAKVAGIEIRE